MAHNKGFAPVLLVIVLAIAGIVGIVYLKESGKVESLVPPTQKECTLEAKICPDGSSVGRTGPNCEFSECPVPTSSSEYLQLGEYSLDLPPEVFTEDTDTTHLRYYFKDEVNQRLMSVGISKNPSGKIINMINPKEYLDSQNRTWKMGEIVSVGPAANQQALVRIEGNDYLIGFQIDYKGIEKLVGNPLSEARFYDEYQKLTRYIISTFRIN